MATVIAKTINVYVEDRYVGLVVNHQDVTPDRLCLGQMKLSDGTVMRFWVRPTTIEEVCAAFGSGVQRRTGR